MFNGDFPFAAMGQMQRQMMEDMDMMMNGMMGGNPFGLLAGFGRPPMNAIQDGRPQQHFPFQSHLVARHQQIERDPFGGFGGIFGAMNGLSERAMSDPSSTVFSQSTVMTFGPDGRPHIVENSVRKAGDVKETRRKVQNGDVASMEIGHTIGDRTHVIEKKRDRDGNVRKQQRFVNLDEEAAEDFDREFATRVRSNYGVGRTTGSNHYLENGGAPTRSHHSSSRSQRTSANAPIVTLPEEDDDEPVRRPRENLRVGGPLIREISEEEADLTVPKRRRGPSSSRFE